MSQKKCFATVYANPHRSRAGSSIIGPPNRILNRTRSIASQSLEAYRTPTFVRYSLPRGSSN